MKDLNVLWPDGTETPVAEIPDMVLMDLVRHPGDFEISGDDHGLRGQRDIRLRLEIEVLIRVKGMR